MGRPMLTDPTKQDRRQLSCLAAAAVVCLCHVGCSHYRALDSGIPEGSRIAVGLVENNTDEPRLSSYVRSKIPELILLDGTLEIVDAESADYILAVTIISYNLNTIGEERIESAEADQRKYRSSIFEVSVDLAYTVTPLNTGDPTQTAIEATASGSADFSELVDIDIVRRDGLRRAVHHACSDMLATIAFPWPD